MAPNLQVAVNNGQTSIVDASGVITDTSWIDTVEWRKGSGSTPDCIVICTVGGDVQFNGTGTTTSVPPADPASTPAVPASQPTS